MIFWQIKKARKHNVYGLLVEFAQFPAELLGIQLFTYYIQYHILTILKIINTHLITHRQLEPRSLVKNINRALWRFIL